MQWIQDIQNEIAKNGVSIITINVQPGSQKTTWKEPLADGTLKISLKEAPEAGKANQALIIFLAKELSVKKESISILAGQHERRKIVRIQ